ncbi:MAG: tetratricopeptide repeat protein [Bryobacteraceae bacterium]
MNGLSRYREAEAEARLALAGDVNRATAWCTLAQALLGQDKHHGAEAAAARAIAEDPQQAHSYYLRAVVLRLMGRLPEAEASIRKAIEISPFIPFYFAELALILVTGKRTEEALAAVALGMKLDPESLILCQVHTRTLVQADCLWDARDSAVRALTIDPENAVSHIQMAEIEFRQNNLVEAEKQYRQALRLNPTAKNVRQSLLVTLRAQSWLYRTFIAQQDQDTVRRYVYGLSLFWMLVFRHDFFEFLIGNWLPFAGMLACYMASVIIVPIYFRAIYVPLSIFMLSLKPINRPVFSRKEMACSQLVTSLFVLGLVLLACAGLRHWDGFGPLGVMALALCLPVTGLFQLDNAREEGVVTFALTLIIIDVCVVVFTLPEGPSLSLGISAVAAIIYASRYIRIPGAPKHVSPPMLPK